nr:putative ribonuclease H-like domain-containing protein [Tanacetum cinerariifolium]
MDVEIKQADLNQKFLTSLAPKWLMYTIVWRNRCDIDTMSLDDVYNHLKIKYEDITQIDEDDIKEMDIKWNMALLIKVECFNCHKMGHFAREYRAPRSQDRGRRESYRQGPKEEEQAPKALMAIDGIGWDWSYMANEKENHALVADDEAPTEFALTAKSSSSYNNEVKKEKEGLDSKLTGFESASKYLDTLLGSQRTDKNKEGLGYSDGNSQNNINDKGYWDNGCSQHITGNISYLSDLNHKWYCLVVTDDFSRFTWTFYLRTKDETSGIRRNFIIEIENLKDLKVKIIRVLVNKSQNKTPYELFNSRTHAIGFLRPFGYHVMILNTFDHLGKFNAKGDEDFLENKLIEKGAGPNWLFDIDILTNSMNYVPVVVAGPSSTNISGTKDATSQGMKKDVSSLRYIALLNWFYDAHMESFNNDAQDACNADAPESIGISNPTVTLKIPPADQMETLIVESVISTVRVEADLSNMESSIPASPTPTFRIHKDHPKSQIIGPVDTPVQTRHKSKDMEEHSFIAMIYQKTTPNLIQFCLFSCFLSQEEPKKIFDALKDPRFLRPFGYHVMILNTFDHLGKFNAKGDEGYFFGYSMSSKAFRVFNKRIKKVEENLHVDFLENKLIEKGAGPNWLFDIDILTNSMNYVPVVVAGPSSTNILGTKDATSQGMKKDVSSLRYIALLNWFHDAHMESFNNDAQDACNADAPESIGISNPTVTLKIPPADKMETLIVESVISIVSSLVQLLA